MDDVWLIENNHFPYSKVHGANMGPIWGRQDPGGPHVGPLNFAIWVSLVESKVSLVWVMAWHQTSNKPLLLFQWQKSDLIHDYVQGIKGKKYMLFVIIDDFRGWVLSLYTVIDLLMLCYASNI